MDNEKVYAMSFAKIYPLLVLMQEIRYLDKLVDELAKGKQIEKILRK